MKRPLTLAFVALTLTALACSLPFGGQPSTPVIPTPVLPEPTNIPAGHEDPTLPPAASGPGITVPPEVASGFSVEEMPANVDGDPWGIAPAHTRFNLQNYALFDKFHQPRIYIYPVNAFIELSEAAAYNIKRLQDAMSAPNPGQLTANDLPGVTFFNAGAVFASNIKPIQFQNGSGLRFLTEYAQYFAPINNRELFYMFQGLSNDGEYYIIAILPITHPALQADEKPETTPPDGGIPFPGESGDPAETVSAYYNQVADLLDISQPNAFAPNLDALDAMIASLTTGK